MKVLFSPSETKTHFAHHPQIDEKGFIFPMLYAKRLEVLHTYETYVRQASLENLQKLFGVKDVTKIHQLSQKSPCHDFTCKAIERYDGIAYDHLSYHALQNDEQQWIDEHVMIFSNLFGPLLAKDLIPHYKLHQGEALGAFKLEHFYKHHFTQAIDEWINGEAILDLRAGFYEKFYTLKSPHITMKFLKKGKVVSHFAKAYRGKVLRQMAMFKPVDENAFLNIAFENLQIVEIKQSTLKREYVCEIID